MTRVIGVLECLEKLCKSLRPSTVFGRTTSFTRHACLLKRFVSKQDFFKKKLVLPAVPEIHSPDQFPELSSVLICDLAPNSRSRVR